MKTNINIQGWQSWSPEHPPLLHIPLRNYAPHPLAPFVIPMKTTQKYKTPIRGWCSWYAYGSNISEANIISHTRWITAHTETAAIEYILIDDGWTQWGDWMFPFQKTFPNGIRGIASKIRQSKKQTGLWMAPFLVSPSSILAATHPEWLISDSYGKRVEGRKITPFDSSFPYKRWILDIRKSHVQTYLLQCIQTFIESWGISLLKLDFLYANHFSPYLSNAEADSLLHAFLAAIKKRYPHVPILACGCPLQPAVGVVDGMRISEDIVNPQLFGKIWLNTIIHTSRLMQLNNNFRKRKYLSQFYRVDPDVFICDPKYGFSNKKITALLKIIQEANGIIFLGDNLLTLPKQQYHFLLEVLS